MGINEKNFFKGDKIKSITTINKFKGIMRELIKGYPAYLYFGIFEYFFGKQASSVINFLEEDGIIRVVPSTLNEPVRYRVTSEGIILATAMTQLDYAEKMNNFTKIIIFLTIGTLIFAFVQALVTLWF